MKTAFLVQSAFTVGSPFNIQKEKFQWWIGPPFNIQKEKIRETGHLKYLERVRSVPSLKLVASSSSSYPF